MNTTTIDDKNEDKTAHKGVSDLDNESNCVIKIKGAVNPHDTSEGGHREVEVTLMSPLVTQKILILCYGIIKG